MMLGYTEKGYLKKIRPFKSTADRKACDMAVLFRFGRFGRKELAYGGHVVLAQTESSIIYITLRTSPTHRRK
jgi:hypothetical protein